MRDHGGDIDGAIARFGGEPGEWIDLSTGINPVPYPLPEIAPRAWTRLPTESDVARLVAAARNAYRTAAAIQPLAGAQALIQLIPRLRPVGQARVLAPTYNEHAAALRSETWAVDEVATLDALAGADIAVVVSPNNPDGQAHDPGAILSIAGRVGLLVVDESFMDPTPERSVAPQAVRPGLLVMRSFGKFYGLAGVRLGFAIGTVDDVARLAEMAGPWPVSGPAIEIGTAALGDHAWADTTRRRLAADTDRLDRLAARAGWRLVGGTALFRLYRTPDARDAQARLARHRIWSRIFPWSPDRLRLGLPGSEAGWARLERATGG